MKISKNIPVIYVPRTNNSFKRKLGKYCICFSIVDRDVRQQVLLHPFFKNKLLKTSL